LADRDAADGWDLIVTPWHLDEHIPAFPVPVGTDETIRPSLPDGDVPGRMRVLHREVAGAVGRAARPLLLSGDCPTALGAVAGLQRRHRDLAVVWLDAHGDFNTPAITISGYLGGMALAMMTGRAPEFSRDSGLRPVADTDIVLADARDLDPAERDALAASQVRRVPADPGAITSAVSELGRMPVYLHLDVDVIDSGQLPGLRFPSGPGPSVTQIEECLAAVCAVADVKAACIACAWLPDRVGDQATRQAITRLAGALGADLTWQVLPGLAAVLERAPAVPAVYCDQGADAAAVAPRVRVTRVLPGDAVDVGQVLIVVDFIDVADDAHVGVPAALVENVERHPGIGAHVLEPLAALVHVHQHPAVVPEVPGGG